MPENSAIDNVKKAFHQLQSSKESLNAALESVEKSDNRQRIENAAHAVENAIETINNTMANYKE
jgi:prefoldin subunit 5